MLGRIRKFSSSILAKIFLFIVAIPFVFWGMGDLFRGGNQNVIVKIANEKISTEDFINYIKYNTPSNDVINKKLIENLFAKFVGEKLMNMEIEDLDIILSNSSLSKIIKNEKIFKRNDNFSRIEYEKFLVSKSIDPVTFEKNLLEQIKKEQLFDFIGGGISPSKFLVNLDFNRINQKRFVKIIDLNLAYKDDINFSDEQIKSHLQKNKEKYIEIYKSVNFLELTPTNLIGANEFNELFFKKIDEIDDLIIEGNNIENIVKKFNLEKFKSSTFNKSGKNKDKNENNNFPNELIENVFKLEESSPIILIEINNKYFVVELTKTQKIYKNITDNNVKKEVLLYLKNSAKRKLLSSLIDKINKNEFTKSDFDNFSKKNNLIKEIVIKNLNDDKILKNEIVQQIYMYPKNKVIVVADIGFSESYLVYIDKIENTSIEKNTNEYEKYYKLSKVKITSNLYNTYDVYLRSKYKIDINYKALDNVKNYF